MASPAVPYPYIDFDIENGVPIGVGALGRVLRVAYRPRRAEAAEDKAAENTATEVTVACKVLSKLQLLQSKKVAAVMTEKAVLASLGPHPLIARLHGTHQSEDELFFFMEEMGRGDLQEHISRVVTARRRGLRSGRDQKESPPLTEGRGGAPARDGGDNDSSVQTEESEKAPWLRGLFCLPFCDVRLILAQLVLALEHCHTNNTPRYIHGDGDASRSGPTSSKAATASEAARGGCECRPHHTGRVALRDLKSENVCFDAMGRCVLIDFDCADDCRGLVPVSNYGDALGEAQRAAESDAAKEALRRRSVSEIQEARRMSAYNFCGTAQFVSPEVLGQLKWSYASDLWALGVIAYQLLFGRYPFVGDLPFLTMKEIVRGLRGEKHFPPSWSPEAAGAVVDPDDAANADSLTPLPAGIAADIDAHAPLYSPEQYALVRSFIEALLVIDPTRRLGVGTAADRYQGGQKGAAQSVGVGGESVDALDPNYSAVFSHPFFSMPTRGVRRSASDGDSLTSEVVPAVDWAALRRCLGLSVPAHFAEKGKERGNANGAAEAISERPPWCVCPSGGAEKGSYVFVPLSAQYERMTSGQCSSPPPGIKNTSIVSLYEVPPFHDDAYSSHADDVCSSAGPLESFMVGLGGDASSSTNAAAADASVSTPLSSSCGADTAEGKPNGVQVLPSSGVGEDGKHVYDWLTGEWSDAYFSNVSANFSRYSGAQQQALAAANTRALLMADAVVAATVRRCGPALAPLMSQWRRLRRGVIASTPPPQSEGNASSSEASVASTIRHAAALEVASADAIVYGALEEAAAALAAEAAQKDAAATAAYLASVAAANEARLREGVVVPLGVNNPYAPHANAPIKIPDLAAAIREAEAEARANARGGDEEADDVIDDVGADRHGRLMRPDSDFSK